MLDDKTMALNALSLLSPGRAASYDTWLAVGMALHAAGCSVEDWIRWYPDGASNHEQTCRHKWDGFGAGWAGSKVTVGTLVKWAREDSGRDPVGIRAAGGVAGETLNLNDSFDVIEVGGWQPGHELLRYVKALYRQGDKIGFVVQAAKTKTKEGVEKWIPGDKGVFGMDYDYMVSEIQTAGPVEAIGGRYEREAGVWCRINPLDGNGVNNDNVVDLRHVLVECDTLPVSQQQAIIEDLQIPCVAIVDSGGKSIHAIVKIDAGTDKDLYQKRVSKLFQTLKERGFEVDRQCRNPARLSRMPGFMRGDRRQFLVATNVGMASWGEWEDFIERRNINALSINKLLAVDFERDDDSLIGNRFVCKGAPWMIVARSGIGKSSLTVQMAICFALGIEFMGLKPKRPLRSMIIQAENADLDLAEPVQGVIKGMGLEDSAVAKVNDNVLFISEDTKFGEEFCQWLDKTITAYAPLDLVWVDPLFAYLGADVCDQGAVSMFLRNWLTPVLHRRGIGMPIIHHTGKVRKKSSDDDWDLAYLGAGSSELTNWPRAVTTLEKIGSNPVTVQLTHAKRGNRLERPQVFIQHATDGRMRWVECNRSDEHFEREAANMPQLKNMAFPGDGSILKWMMERFHLPQNDAKILCDRWRKCADQNYAGPWERVQGTDGKWRYQGKNVGNAAVAAALEDFDEPELP